MTVANTNYKSGPYNCNGSVIDFTFDFLIFDGAEDLDVYLTDNTGNTLLEYGTHYDVIGVGGVFTSGGTVQTVQAYPTGSQITIIRNLELLSQFDLTESGKIPAESLESAIDRCVLMCQQLAIQNGKGILLPVLEDMTLELPETADRAEKFLYFAADGTVSVKGLAELGAVTADEFTIVLIGSTLSVKDGGISLAKLAAEVMAAVDTKVSDHNDAANPHSGKFAAPHSHPYEPENAVSTHESAINPHSQYNKSLTAWGMVTGSTGAILDTGSGNWTVARSATGQYQLNITDSGDYMLIANVINPSNGNHTSNTNSCQASWELDTNKFKNNSSANVRVFDAGIDSWRDNDWSFIAIKL